MLINREQKWQNTYGAPNYDNAMVGEQYNASEIKIFTSPAYNPRIVAVNKIMCPPVHQHII